MDNISTLAEAVEIMLVGMFAVFCALILVILAGKLIIAFSNRYYKNPPEISGGTNGEIPSKTIAAITAAVNSVSRGKAAPASIRKK